MTSVTFWGVTASPFQLKMQALADAANLSWQRWPDEGGLLENLRFLKRLSAAQRSCAVQRFPEFIPGLDEYPAVPFYSLDGQHFYYDSSGFAMHLDSLAKDHPPLLPTEPASQFICRLIDEAFDEFGLYMVHHNRWVTSGATNCMGDMTVREMRKLIPPGMRGAMARRLARRQARRCPYLFSVAPPGFDVGAPGRPSPPAREGFPPTHALLDKAWRRYLAVLEELLSRQPYLLGRRFTLADASAYGQLSMNLVDGRAADLLREQAPTTYDWLCLIRDGGHSDSAGDVSLGDSLNPLLEIISETFIPLMQQNATAYDKALKGGQREFNESAFDKHKALYDGELMGTPFRAGIKSFQVPVWRNLCDAWRELAEGDREQLQSQYPALGGADFSCHGS